MEPEPRDTTVDRPRVATPPSRRLPYIDVLRGIACLWVLFHHAAQEGLPPFLADVDALLPPLHLPRLVSLGYLGVHLFLVLSGFCLTYPLVTRNPLSDVSLDVREFARRRALRILPPYYAALVLFGLLAYGQLLPFDRPAVWYDIPAHLLMLHNLFPATIATISLPFWSLALESQLYVLFPILILFARKHGLVRLLVVSLIIGVAWQRACVAIVPLLAAHAGVKADSWTGNAPWYWSVPGRLFEFVCGMAAAYRVARGGTSAPRRALTVLSCFLPLSLLATLGAAPGIFTVWNDHLWGVTFASLVVACSGVSAERFTGRAWEALIEVGVMSFSLYLVHYPLLRLINASALTRFDITQPVRCLIFWLLVFPFLIVAGRVFYGLFESPQWRKRPSPPLELSRT